MKFFGNLSWKTFLFGMLAVVWMAVIFFFSSQPAQQSTDTSHWAGRMIGNIIIRDFEQWSQEEQGNFTEKIDLVVRKTAHAMEYAFLCFLIFMTFHSRGLSGIRCFGIALLMTTGYAVTDEIHQLFVPGRSGRMVDVLIDSAGAVVGAGAGNVLISIKKKIKHSQRLE